MRALLLRVRCIVLLACPSVSMRKSRVITSSRSGGLTLIVQNNSTELRKGPTAGRVASDPPRSLDNFLNTTEKPLNLPGARAPRLTSPRSPTPSLGLFRQLLSGRTQARFAPAQCSGQSSCAILDLLGVDCRVAESQSAALQWFGTIS